MESSSKFGRGELDSDFCVVEDYYITSSFCLPYFSDPLNELNSNMVSTIITDRLQRPISMDALDKHPIVIGPASHIEYLPENIPAGSWVIIFTFVYSSSVAVQFITSVFTNHNKICKRYRSGAWSEFVAIINI